MRFFLRFFVLSFPCHITASLSTYIHIPSHDTLDQDEFVRVLEGKVKEAQEKALEIKEEERKNGTLSENLSPAELQFTQPQYDLITGLFADYQGDFGRSTTES